MKAWLRAMKEVESIAQTLADLARPFVTATCLEASPPENDKCRITSLFDRGHSSRATIAARISMETTHSRRFR
jgi:hypothetical protein